MQAIMETIMKMLESPQTIEITYPRNWIDYELLDSGNGRRLERFGPYTFIRPAPQAVWSPGYEAERWQAPDAIFQPAREESGGQWLFPKPLRENPWVMAYKDLRITAFASGSRHMGIFPEQAPHWDWIEQNLIAFKQPTKVLNLFGYTGLATLAAANAGAKVTHVDASKKYIHLAQQNQAYSGLQSASIRWICDDAIKFVAREVRRGSTYDGILLDPPKFGRGPKGEVWEFFDLLPKLLATCQSILSRKPLFVVLTAYAIQASALGLYNSLLPLYERYGGSLTCGELGLQETSRERILPMSIYGRWSSLT